MTVMAAKILCIEDEALIRQLVVEELNDEGYETIEAANGYEGLKAILQQDPDLVLCDVSMPGMDGFEMLEMLRTHHPDRDGLPVIFMTGLVDGASKSEGRRLGVDSYLAKPIDYDVLHAALARLLGCDEDPEQIDEGED